MKISPASKSKIQKDDRKEKMDKLKRSILIAKGYLRNMIVSIK